MRKLILVRHSLPRLDPTLRATQWRISDTGRLRCKSLADRLADYRPNAIVTSAEPKAVETAQIVGDVLGISPEPFEGLHEHDRSDLGVVPPGEFEARMADLFKTPQCLVLGAETADETYRRFAKALNAVIKLPPHGNLAVVTHGTVMALFVARVAGVGPFSFWKKLDLPSFVILSVPEFRLLGIVESVTAEN